MANVPTPIYTPGDAGRAFVGCVDGIANMITAAAHQMAHLSRMIEEADAFVMVEVLEGGENGLLPQSLLRLAEEQLQLATAIGDATAAMVKRWEKITSRG